MNSTLPGPADQLRTLLRTRWLGRAITYAESLASTQDEARRVAVAGAPAGTLVWASGQTAGRGRSDRTWLSAPGSGLWFSFVLRPQLPPERVAFLGLLTGVAMADAIRRRTGADVRLKWPNDLLVGGGKLGGILAEAAMARHATEWVVVGIGLNLNAPQGGFDPALGGNARALEGYARRAVAPAALLASCLGAIERHYEAFLAGGPEAARRRWLRLADTIGRRVAADLGAERVEGIATDLDPDGALVLTTPAGPRRVNAGEVVHLR